MFKKFKNEVKNKILELSAQMLTNEKGISTMELMLILALVAVIILGTVGSANATISTWWTTKIMPNF